MKSLLLRFTLVHCSHWIRKLEVAQQTAKESAEFEQLTREQKLDTQAKESLVSQRDEYEQRIQQLNERKEQLAERVARVEELRDSSHA